VAQDLLYQAFEKASRGKVEKPLHYAAVSALHIAIDRDKRQANTLAYHKALSGKRLDWEPEYGKADKASAVVFKKISSSCASPLLGHSKPSGGQRAAKRG
jgi:hypothetical protein